MAGSCPKCGGETPLPNKCATCKRIETVDNAMQTSTDGGYGPTGDVDPDPRNDIIRHIAAASRVLRRRSKRNHEDRRDQLDALIRRVRHDRITRAELRNELRAHYTSDDVQQVDAIYELRSAAQHAARYTPESHADADDDSMAEVIRGP